MRDKKFYIGQKLKARWPEDHAWYPATIVKINGEKITVKWEDDAEPPSVLDEDDVG